MICAESGLYEASYSGPVSRAGYDILRTEMMAVENTPRACIVRVDRALILANAMPELPPGVLDPTPTAMIVREDQYAIFHDYALRLAKQGALRLVFPERHARRAYDWARDRCLASISK